ncbi:MAG: efflux RND transporter periplasmic adaptor subunit [Nodosilinea sp.]
MVFDRWLEVGRGLGRLPGLVIAGGIAIAAFGCSQPEPTARPPVEQNEGPVVVDVAVAAAEASGRTYTGTTQPVRQVSLRSQAEGRLLDLTVDVSDAVQQGQVVGRLDSALLQAAVGEAQAELAARQFEVSQAEAELADVRTATEQARVQLQQAGSDAQRLQALANQGALAEQEAEQAQTTLRTAEQALQSTQARVRTRQQAVAAAQQRVEAQRSILREAQARLSFANLAAPLTGIVLEREAEPGDLVLPGDAVLSLGDLSEVLVVIQVADSSLSKFSLGQSLDLAIDALAGESFTGSVTRISPVADSASRQLPIEITVANPGGRIGSGLLARVATGDQAVRVPTTALSDADEGQIFVVTKADGTAVVEARSVQVGDRADGQATILSGLTPGEQYVVRSSQPLESGQTVELSLTSEG